MGNRTEIDAADLQEQTRRAPNPCSQHSRRHSERREIIHGKATKKQLIHGKVKKNRMEKKRIAGRPEAKMIREAVLEWSA
ncbi:hypothetical protein LTR40_009669, partial [Exophiala xenobiotica]